MASSSELVTDASERTSGQLTLAWLTLLVVLAGLTSLVAAGLYLAVVLSLVAAVGTLRRSTRWTVRMPLLLAVALVAVTLLDWARQTWL